MSTRPFQLVAAQPERSFSSVPLFFIIIIVVIVIINSGYGCMREVYGLFTSSPAVLILTSYCLYPSFFPWYSKISQATGLRAVCFSWVCVGIPSYCRPPHSLAVSIKAQQPINKLALSRQAHWAERAQVAVSLLCDGPLERGPAPGRWLCLDHNTDNALAYRRS